jgi:hypothetical protein
MTAEFLLRLLKPEAVVGDARLKFRCTVCAKKESRIQPIGF